jgi:hypothetical protein
MMTIYHKGKAWALILIFDSISEYNNNNNVGGGGNVRRTRDPHKEVSPFPPPVLTTNSSLPSTQILSLSSSFSSSNINSALMGNKSSREVINDPAKAIKVHV